MRAWTGRAAITEAERAVLLQSGAAEELVAHPSIRVRPSRVPHPRSMTDWGRTEAAFTPGSGRSPDDSNPAASLSARFNDISFRALVILNNHIGAVHGLSIVSAVVVELQLYSFAFDDELIRARFSELLIFLRGGWLTVDAGIHLLSYACVVFMLVVCVATLLSLGLISARSRYHRPLRLLQLVLATTMPQFLLIPSIAVCIELLACHSPLTDALQCGSFQHVVVAMISLIIIFVIVALAYLYESVFFDFAPAPPSSLLARTDRAHHCHSVLIRVLLCVTQTLQAPADSESGTKPWAMAAMLVLTSHYSAYSFLQHQPFTSASVAIASGASIWIRVWLSQIVLLRVYYDGVAWDNALLAGVLLTGAHFVATIVSHNQRILTTPLQHLSLSELSARIRLEVLSIQSSRASSWFVGRGTVPAPSLRSLRDKGRKRIRDVADFTLEKFPESVHLHCQLCMVVYAVLDEHAWADRVLLHGRASMTTLGFASAFMVHRLQSHLNAGNRARVDLLQKMAIEKQVAGANSQINFAIYRQMQLWRHLLRGSLPDPARFHALKIATLCTEIAIAVETANSMLEKLSALTSGTDVGVLRQQAHFYMAVLGDVQTGTRLMEKADTIETHMREVHHEVDGALHDADAAADKTYTGSLPSAYIIVKASGAEVGIVRQATPDALAMLGRDQTDLLGRNMSVILPEQISRQHDHLVRRFVKGAGEHEIVDITRELFAVHGKTKHLVLAKVTLSLMPDDPDQPSATAVIAKMQPLDQSVIAALLDSATFTILHATESMSSLLGLHQPEGMTFTDIFTDLHDNMANAFAQDGVLVSVSDSPVADKAVVKLKSLLTTSLMMAKIELQQAKFKGATRLVTNRPRSPPASGSETSRSGSDEPATTTDDAPAPFAGGRRSRLKMPPADDARAESEGRSSASAKSSLSALRNRIWHSRKRTDVLVLRINAIILIGAAIMLAIIALDIDGMNKFLRAYQDRFTEMTAANNLGQALLQLAFTLQSTSAINAGLRTADAFADFSTFHPQLSRFESDTYAFLAYGERSSDAVTARSYQHDRVVIQEQGFPLRYLSFSQGVKNVINRAKSVDRNSTSTDPDSGAAFVLSNMGSVACGFANLARISVDVGFASNQSVRTVETTELSLFSFLCLSVAVFICPRLVYARKAKRDLLEIFLQVPQDQVLSMVNRFRTSLSDAYLDEGDGDLLLDDKLGEEAAAAALLDDDTDDALGRLLLHVFRQWLSLSSLALSAFVLAVGIFVYRESAFVNLNEIFNDSYESGRRAILLEWFLFDTERALLSGNASTTSLAFSRLSLAFHLHHALEFGGRIAAHDLEAGLPPSPALILADGPAPIDNVVLKGSVKRFAAHESLWLSESPGDVLSGAAQPVMVGFYQLGNWVLTTHPNLSSPDLSDLRMRASQLRAAFNADTSYYTEEMTAILRRLMIGTKITIILFFTGWATVFVFVVTPTLRELNTQLYRTRFLCTLIPYNILKELPLFREKFAHFALGT